MSEACRNNRWARPRARGAALAGVVVAVTLLGSPAVANTTTQAGLGGYSGRAHASGLHAFYFPEGVLPIASPIDYGAPDALATIVTGPSTFARAAVFDPGDLLANPEALFVQADPNYPGGTIPPYPYRAEARSSVGDPTVESNPAPGLNARATARDGRSQAQATTPRSEAPGVMTVGSMLARSTTTTNGSTVTVRSRSEVSSFSFLGVINIDSVVTDLVATGDGTNTTLEGGTTITGATVMGQPVTIDKDGVHAQQDLPLGELLGIGETIGLNEQLAAAGIRITLAEPLERSTDDSGWLATTGVRIDLEISRETQPALAALAEAIPSFENPIPQAPSIDDLKTLLTAPHITTIGLGRGVVELQATQGYDPPPFGSFTPSAPSTLGASPLAPAPLATGSVAPLGPSPAPGPPATPGAPVAVDNVASASLGAGIGALVLLALIAQPFLGAQVARAAGAVLGTDPSSTCPKGGLS